MTKAINRFIECRLNAHLANHIDPLTEPMADHVKALLARMHDANIVEHQFNGMNFEDAERTSLDYITQAAKELWS